MNDIDVSKIPDDVWRQAGIATITGEDEQVNERQQKAIAIAILQERADCAKHAFAMRWSPMIGTQKNAKLIIQITTDWSQKIGMGILNRGEK